MIIKRARGAGGHKVRPYGLEPNIRVYSWAVNQSPVLVGLVGVDLVSDRMICDRLTLYFCPGYRNERFAIQKTGRDKLCPYGLKPGVREYSWVVH